MKYSAIFGAALLAQQAAAFPSYANVQNLPRDKLDAINNLADKITREAEKKRQLVPNVLSKPKFDPKQLVEVHGDHEFRAPGPNDLRGPCPGLNMLANHGYISRDGLTNTLESTEASFNAFGMDYDLGGFLSAYSAIMAGDLNSFSIGGPPKPDGLLQAVGLLGQPQGLSLSHNRFEADVSPTRRDYYQPGGHHDAGSLDVPLFQQLWDLQEEMQGENGFDLKVMNAWRVKHFYQSVNTNPYFFQSPFGVFAVQTATHIFTYRFCANHSEDNLEGYLGGDLLKTMWSVTGEPGNFKWVPGHDRIPENFYRRAYGNEYGFAQYIPDALDALKMEPDLLVIGGNTGKPNTFTGVNITDLTGGVFNAETLLEGNNFFCFAFQAANEAAPDILRGLYKNIAQPLAKLNQAVGKVLTTLNCPELTHYDPSLFDQFPGSKGVHS